MKMFPFPDFKIIAFRTLTISCKIGVFVNKFVEFIVYFESSLSILNLIGVVFHIQLLGKNTILLLGRIIHLIRTLVTDQVTEFPRLFNVCIGIGDQFHEPIVKNMSQNSTLILLLIVVHSCTARSEISLVCVYCLRFRPDLTSSSFHLTL